MSLELSGYEVGSGKHIDEGSGPKKKKVDYSDKIKELEHRLYNKWFFFLVTWVNEYSLVYYATDWNLLISNW